MKPTKKEILRAMAIALHEEQQLARNASDKEITRRWNDWNAKALHALRLFPFFAPETEPSCDERGKIEIYATVNLDPDYPMFNALVAEYSEIKKMRSPSVESVDKIELRLRDAERTSAGATVTALLQDPVVKAELLKQAHEVLTPKVLPAIAA
ncbi:MAG: hypothetical protein U1G08_02510 [Verrucomicrobiota bacterium]